MYMDSITCIFSKLCAKRNVSSLNFSGSGTYLFIHYALLVAYVARSSEILANLLGTPQSVC